MDYRMMELDLKMAFSDKRFKITDANNSNTVIDKLEDILIRITKFNDALGNLSYLQTYYRDLFELNKDNYADFNYDCSDIEQVISDEQDRYIQIFNSFLKAIYDNLDLREYLSFDIPITIKVINKISKGDNSYKNFDTLKKLLYKWLTYVSYEEDTSGKLYLFMEKAIEEIYKRYYKEEKK